jgi:hypothetical protein
MIILVFTIVACVGSFVIGGYFAGRG